MKWLITGGCGFIGRNLIARLLQGDASHAVRVFDNLSVGKRADLAQVASCRLTRQPRPGDWPAAGSVDLVPGDVLDAELAVQAAAGAEVIVHLAANTGVGPSVENPRRDCVTNVIGTLNLLEAARKSDVRRFVFASSGAPLGTCVPPIHEELAPHPVSPYGASKLAGEGYCSAYFQTFRVETVALRFGNVYGPRSGHKSSAVARFVQQLLRGEELVIFGDGSQTRDFIFVEDLVQAIELAAARPEIGGEVFQIATNSETTVRQLVTELAGIARKLGCPPARVRYEAPRLGDVARNYSDVTKAAQRLGWTAATPLRDGLEQTFRWFAEAANRADALGEVA